MTLVQALCFFCVTLSSPPYPQLSQRAEGDIWYTYERPSGGTHLLRLSTTDYLIDSDGPRVERLDAFAYRFADQTCRGRFTLAPAMRKSWPVVRPVYARQYVFRCR
jgi:hypothetical protein